MEKKEGKKKEVKQEDTQELKSQISQLQNQLLVYQNQELMSDTKVYRYHQLRILNAMGENLEKVASQLNSISQQIYDANKLKAEKEGLVDEEDDDEGEEEEPEGDPILRDDMDEDGEVPDEEEEEEEEDDDLKKLEDEEAALKQKIADLEIKQKSSKAKKRSAI